MATAPIEIPIMPSNEELAVTEKAQQELLNPKIISDEAPLQGHQDVCKWQGHMLRTFQADFKVDPVTKTLLPTYAILCERCGRSREAVLGFWPKKRGPRRKGKEG